MRIYTYVRAKAWDAGQPSMSAEDLRCAFAKRMRDVFGSMDMGRLVLDAEPMKE